MLRALLHVMPAALTPGDLLLLAYIAFAMPVHSLVSGARLRKLPLDHSRRVRRYAQVIARGWATAAFLLVVWRVAQRPWSGLGLDWPVGFRGLCGLAVVLVAAGAFSFEQWRLRKKIGAKLPALKARVDAKHILPQHADELAVFVVMAVTAGVWEELLFRGYLFWVLVPSAHAAGAIVISSALFGLAHLYQGWKGVLTTGAVGVALAAGYAVTQSLWWLIALHAVLDIFGGIVAFRVQAMHRHTAASRIPG